jgi:hypothetical protein
MSNNNDKPIFKTAEQLLEEQENSAGFPTSQRQIFGARTGTNDGDRRSDYLQDV